MIIFDGYGGLGVIVLLGVPLGVGIPLLIADQMRLFHMVLPRTHADSISLFIVAFGTSLAIAAAGWITWRAGKMFNRHERIHTIYFVPMEIWGQIEMILGGIFAIKLAIVALLALVRLLLA